METLLGHTEAVNGNGTQAAPGSIGRRPRTNGDWFPLEGAPLAMNTPRSSPKLDELVSNRFGLEFSTSSNGLENGLGRERDLMSKLHELLASPLAEPIARIVEESYRLLPGNAT